MELSKYLETRRVSRLARIAAKLAAMLMPFVPGYRMRIRLYRLMGVNIGEGVYIGRECFLDDEFPELITIKDGACISFRVILVAHDMYRGIVGPVTVGEASFVGAGSIILPGTTVGRGAVVAAGSVVTRDVPPGTMAAGVPNRTVKVLTERA